MQSIFKSEFSSIIGSFCAAGGAFLSVSSCWFPVAHFLHLAVAGGLPLCTGHYVVSERGRKKPLSLVASRSSLALQSTIYRQSVSAGCNRRTQWVDFYLLGCQHIRISNSHTNLSYASNFFLRARSLKYVRAHVKSALAEYCFTWDFGNINEHLRLSIPPKKVGIWIISAQMK